MRMNKFVFKQKKKKGLFDNLTNDVKRVDNSYVDTDEPTFWGGLANLILNIMIIPFSFLQMMMM